MRISVIIPTKDRTTELFKCIDSILRQTYPPDEIFVVDSSKNKNLHLLLKRRFPASPSEIKYIYSKVSNNAARNIGVKHSSGDLLFFFDDDVVLDQHYIAEMVNFFEKDRESRIKGAMGNIVNTLRPRGEILRKIFFLSSFGDGKYKPSGLPTVVHGIKQKARTDFLSGCMMTYRKEVFQEYAFDENLGKLGGYCYLDDVDFSYRVSRKYPLLYIPSAKLEHNHTKVARVNSTLAKRQFLFNHFHLFKKNMPKNFSNVFAFCLSIFGLLLLTLLRMKAKETIGVLQGIRDATLTL